MKRLAIPFLMTILIFGLLFGSQQRADACLEIPHNPPDIVLIELPGADEFTPDTTKVRLLNYTTFGSSSDYCACALNLPLLYGYVISASIVYAGTETPLAEFDFTSNTDAADTFREHYSEADWQAFSTETEVTIATGVEVDLVFCVITYSQDEPATRDSRNAVQIQNFLQNALFVVATGGGPTQGFPTGHIGIMPAGLILIMGSAIPTVSEWGLIIMSLMFMAVGMTLIKRRVLAANTDVWVDSTSTIWMETLSSSLFTKIGAILVAIAVGVIALFLMVGITVTVVDVIGSLICTAVATYIVAIWMGPRH